MFEDMPGCLYVKTHVNIHTETGTCRQTERAWMSEWVCMCAWMWVCMEISVSEWVCMC